MAQVSNLTINIQPNSDRYYASWTFERTVTEAVSGSVKKGDWVTVNEGATWINGVSIADWVFDTKLKVLLVRPEYKSLVLGPGDGGITGEILESNVTPIDGSTTTTTKDESDTVDHYEVEWYYTAGNDHWLKLSEESVDPPSYSPITSGTVSPDSNALQIEVKVKPVSKTYKDSSGNEQTHWEGTWASKKYTISSSQRPADISAPDVKIEGETLTATIENISDPYTTHVQFEGYKDDNTYASFRIVQPVRACRAELKIKVSLGGMWRVRCRGACNTGAKNVFGEWSDFSNPQATAPKAVTRLNVQATSPTAFTVAWAAVAEAKSYEVEYTTEYEYFDTSNQVSSTTVTTNLANITGVESDQYFVRVRAVNDAGESEWSPVATVIIGTIPEAPTTWALTSTAVVGEDVIFYWVHNCEDGSAQTEAEIQLVIDGVTTTVEWEGEKKGNSAGSSSGSSSSSSSVYETEEENPIYQYTLDTSAYSAGAVILWKVRTKGAVDQFGDWSVQRTVKIYARPEIHVTLSAEEDILTSLPLMVNASSSPTTQTPISYHISVIANRSYETTDNIGNPRIVSAGTEVYSEVFDYQLYDIAVIISAGDATFEAGQSYTVKATVSMDSGLTATDSAIFETQWTDPVLFPDAGITVDREALATYIAPFCVDSSGECSSGVTVSVYRREYNGTFTEIASNLPNTRSIGVIDPHPALDYARYRIVALDNATGAITYEDLPGVVIKEPSIVIQWDEQWSDFDSIEGATSEVPPWTGSMLKLPYNIDISESYNPDVSLIEYIGRKHPVSYYGTQRGETATWSTDIDKSDKELIYALRRLAAWKGDVYVREPSGTGYWAHITVSMPIKHLELVIPVSFTISRVEGSGI